MPAPSGDVVRAASGLANRLRLTQIDCADDDAATRRQYLASEVAECLGKVQLEDRQAFLKELTSRFPLFSHATGDAVEPGPPQAESAPPTDPGTLVRRLQESFAAMPAQDKEAVLDGVLSGVLGEAIEARLGESPAAATPGPDDQAVDAGLADILADYVDGVERYVWKTWEEIAPRTPTHRPVGLKRGLDALSGPGGEEARAQLKKGLLETRSLVVAFMTAIPIAGRLLAQNHLSELTPSRIEQWARMNKGLMTTLEKASWDRFKQLGADGLGVEVIDDQTRNEIAGHIDGILQKL